jgi:LysR family pca operon transcriptional activator
MDIKPRYLRYLAAIGTHGSFVKAAGSLSISQPALSLSIQRIEDITKTRLVDRGRHGAKLTRAGHVLARHGREIEASILSASDEIDLLSHGISGRLRIGGTPLSTSGLIPEVISRILNITNDVAISVTESVDEDLMDLLARNELDVVIGAPGLGANQESFITRPLFSAKTVLVARAGHRLLKKKTVSLADLQDALWAIPPRGGTFRTQIEALFTANGVPFPQRTIQAASIYLLKRIVRGSDAVTLAAEQIVRDEVQRRQLGYLDIAEPVALRAFGLHTRAKKELGDLGELFCQLAVELAPEFAAPELN